MLPKPNTASPHIREELTARYPYRQLDREWTSDPGTVIEEFDQRIGQNDFAIVDIGGYFSRVIDPIAAHYGSRFLGIMEGTENGLAKYRSSGVLAAPVFTVADSRLKYPENHLVGVSVVHSIESVVRETGDVLQNRRACVIGFGKVGKSVAEAFRGRGVPVTVFDVSAVPMAEAAARGFIVQRTLEGALRHADLVAGATGNQSLNYGVMSIMKPGTMIATVTSGDDEFAPDALTGWRIRSVPTAQGTPVTEYTNRSTHVYVLNDAHTINFLHGAVIGPAIQLIEGEKLAAVHALTSQPNDPGIHHVDEETREEVASIWLDHFLTDTP